MQILDTINTCFTWKVVNWISSLWLVKCLSGHMVSCISIISIFGLNMWKQCISIPYLRVTQKNETEGQGIKKLAQCSLCCLNRHQKGIFVDGFEKDCQFSSLVGAAKSNISINQLIEISWCWIDKLSGRMIGAAGDLVNTCDDAVLWTILDYLLKIICYVCYPEYSYTIYGMRATPDTESIILRLVTKDWKIIKLLVKSKLFQKKVTAEELANNLV